MSEGRFGAFRDHLMPNSTVQMSSNVAPDVHLLMLCTAFAVPYLAFLIILPGIRGNRLASFITVTITFVVGFVSLGAIFHPGWNSGAAVVVSQFHAHSAQRVEAFIGAHVGLYSLNITMNHITSVELSEKRFDGVRFNEKFDITSVGSMGEELQAAYRKGLPYPMLRLLEYFSLNEGSFDWGRKYRLAGHYAGASLWMGFVLWILQVIVLCAVPHNFAKVAVGSGLFTLSGAILYVLLCPRQLKIFFTGVNGSITLLEMHYGVCFFAALAAGLLNTLFGGVLCVVQFLKLYTLSTFLDASMDEHVVPSCSKKLKARRAFESSSSCSSLAFVTTLKCLQSVDPGAPSSLNVASSGFNSGPSSIRSYASRWSSDEEVFRRSRSDATIESSPQPSHMIVDRF